MGLRCLLGHDFTEPETEREREERGDEVVTTIREVKECRRCGETQVVAENTEVTSLSGRFDPARTDAGTGAGDVADASPSVESTGTPGTAPVEQGGGAGRDAGPDSVIDEAEPADEGFDHPRGDPDAVDPTVEDDAEIIREGPSDARNPESADQPAGGPDERSAGAGADGSSDDERGHGEWPDSEKTHPTEAEGEAQSDVTGGWPDPDAKGDDRGSGRDTEDPAATEARSGFASAVDRAEADDAASDDSGADAGGRSPAAEDEDVEFIDADDAADPDDDGDPTPWPEQEGEDEGFNAEVGDGRPDEDVTVDGNLTPRVNPNAEVDDDAEFVEASSGPSTSPGPRSSTDDGVGAGRGRSSGSPTSPPPEHARNGSRGASVGGGRAERTRNPTATHEVELTTTAGDRELEYVCPECGNREPVGASSMRAGDICPECKRGYIEERELE